MTTQGKGRPAFDEDVLLSDDVFPLRPPTREEVRQSWLDARHHHPRLTNLSDAEFLDRVEEIMAHYDSCERYSRAFEENPPRGLPVPVGNRRRFKGYAAEVLRLAKLKRHNIRA